MKLGRPEQFHDKETIRLRSIDRAIAQYRFSAETLRKSFAHMIDEHTSFYLKGFGNEVNLLAATRDLFFASRELIDLYLGRLRALTAASGKQTPHDLLPFLRRVLTDGSEHVSSPQVAFLKNNATYLFNIRKVRNELKGDPSSAEFLFNTDHFELRMKLPVKKEEEALISHLDIRNADQAIANKSYVAVFNLDILFPEMAEFWAAYRSLENARSAL